MLCQLASVFRLISKSSSSTYIFDPARNHWITLKLFLGLCFWPYILVRWWSKWSPRDSFWTTTLTWEIRGTGWILLSYYQVRQCCLKKLILRKYLVQKIRNYTVPKIWNINSQEWNCMASLLISHSCICEWFTYIFSQSALGRPILGIYKSLTDT